MIIWRYNEAAHTVEDGFRRAAGVANNDRQTAGSRLERGQAKPLGVESRQAGSNREGEHVGLLQLSDYVGSR